MLKNARLAEQAAQSGGASHPLISASRELYEEAEVDGRGAEDMIGVIAALAARASGGVE